MKQHLPHLEVPETTSALDYVPPTVVTLVERRNRYYYARLESWCPPPGWEQFPSILEFSVFPRRRRGLDPRSLGDCAIIRDPVTEDVHSLNETAVCLFALCDGTRDLRSIRDAYAERYDLTSEHATDDVCVLLSELFEKRLLFGLHAASDPCWAPPFENSSLPNSHPLHEAS